jgi:hypothetical protein
MRNIAAALLLGTTALSQAPVVQTVLNNGTTNSRYDMVILGDGYQAFEQPKFNQDVNTFLTALFNKEPYKTFAAYYNVHTVFRASNESGADQPDVTPPIFVDTAYDCTYNVGGTDRCLYIGDTALGLADAALAPANEGRILVLVNSSRYGGCASTFAVSYNGLSMTEVQAHELGHSLGQLADEYDYAGQTYTGSEPSQVNATTSPTGQKWSHWHGTDGISAFEGCRYYQFGLFRPRSNCMMRSLGQTLCSVCREQVSKITNSIVDVIVSATPSGPVTITQAQVQPFGIGHIVPSQNSPLITWTLDGVVIPGATTTLYSLDPSGLTVGVHTLEVRVLDRTTFVRVDPAQTMLESHTWQVTVQPGPTVQLHATSLTTSGTWQQPGGPMTLTSTVANDGNTAAGPFDVDFFLSLSSSWTENDIWLGRETVAGLPAGQSMQILHATQLPWRIEARPYVVNAVIDRTDQVVESVETDNSASSIILGLAVPCFTKLEYADPLALAHEGAGVSVTAGGTAHPTLVATCANPLVPTLYLIVWSGSGTTPGTPLSPTVQLPLNLDGYTDLGIANATNPLLDGFLGLLDSKGVGHAKFELPPATGLIGAQTHLAGVVFGLTTMFESVSNPIELTLLP